jgi:hypothetical protein
MSEAIGTYDDCECPCDADCCTYWNGTTDNGAPYSFLTNFGFGFPAGPVACSYRVPTYFSHYFLWEDVEPSDGATITSPIVVAVGAVTTMTLTDLGPGMERRTSPDTYSADFCNDETTSAYGGNSEAILFFRTPPGPAYDPGGPVRMEFDPPVCAVGFAFQQNQAAVRDDLFAKIWLDGVLDSSVTGISVDSNSPSLQAANFLIFRIANGGTGRITKIEFGLLGSALSGPPASFAIGSVGICI